MCNSYISALLHGRLPSGRENSLSDANGLTGTFGSCRRGEGGLGQKANRIFRMPYRIFFSPTPWDKLRTLPRGVFLLLPSHRHILFWAWTSTTFQLARARLLLVAVSVDLMPAGRAVRVIRYTGLLRRQHATAAGYRARK